MGASEMTDEIINEVSDLREDVFNNHQDMPWRGNIISIKGDEPFGHKPKSVIWYEEIDVVTMMDEAIRDTIKKYNQKQIDRWNTLIKGWEVEQSKIEAMETETSRGTYQWFKTMYEMEQYNKLEAKINLAKEELKLLKGL